MAGSSSEADSTASGVSPPGALVCARAGNASKVASPMRKIQRARAIIMRLRPMATANTIRKFPGGCRGSSPPLAPAPQQSARVPARRGGAGGREPVLMQVHRERVRAGAAKHLANREQHAAQRRVHAAVVQRIVDAAVQGGDDAALTAYVSGR